MNKIESITIALCFLTLITFEALADSTTTIMYPDGSVSVCTVGDNGIIICI